MIEPLPIEEDTKGNRIIKIAMDNGEHFRVTYVPDGWHGEPSLRVEKFDANNKHFMGPEIPVSVSHELVQALAKMLVDRGHW